MLTSVALALIPVGCLASALGLLLMKSSTELHAHLPAYRSWRWLLGFLFLGVLATLVDVTVLGVLPLSVVAPFAGLTIVFSLLLAASGALATRERLRAVDASCCALIITGITLVSVF